VVETPAILPSSPLDGVMQPGRYGHAAGAAGVVARERRNVAMASVIARRGQHAALSAKVKARTGLDLPATPRFAGVNHLGFLWLAPGQWIASAAGEVGAIFASELAQDLIGLASVTDQSDGRVLIRVSGPRVRDMLAKGCMIDLHQSVFKIDDTAITSIALLTVQVTRLPDDEGLAVFELAIMRSFAANLWHWLESSAAEFGLDIA
jgi:methylglutamate dehydrogenase subunit D